MANPKGPKGFIVVTPTGIIEIPQDSYLSWLTMFYLMPRVLVEKWPEALKIPRKPFEALRSQACLDIIKQDMFAAIQRIEGEIKELVTLDTRLDEDVKLLCSIPGIGFSSAVVIAAEMGDISLFRKPKQLAAYFGLDPG